MSDVLLLHAGIADRRMWAPQIDALEAAGHRVLAPDLPGFGDAALEPPTVDYVAFAVDLLDGPAAIVGCSFGGRVALEIAGSRPDLVRRLVLVAPGLGSTAWSEDSRPASPRRKRSSSGETSPEPPSSRPGCGSPRTRRPRCAR